MAYTLQGSVSRYDAENNPLEYDFTKKDIQTLAKEAGYKGPKEFASSYLQGLRDSSGNITLHPNGQTSRDPRVTSVLESYGINAPRVFQNEYENLATYDPQANAAAQQWANENRSNFTLEPWMLAAAPLAVGGLQAAGMLGAEGAGAGLAADGAAAGEFSLGSGATGSGIGGGSAGLGYGGAGGVGTTGGFGLGATGATAGSGVAAGLGASGLASVLPAAGGTTFGIPNNLLAGVLQGGLGYLGADKQADAYQNVANQNLAIGAPFRNLLGQSYGQDFNLMSQPGYGDAFNRMADISTRAWSAKAGNPANNPGIQGGILNDVWNQSYLPALANYRGQLGQFGGLGLNTAGLASLGGAQTADDGLAALAGGAGRIFGGATQPTIEDLLKKIGGTPNYDLTVGGVKY